MSSCFVDDSGLEAGGGAWEAAGSTKELIQALTAPHGALPCLAGCSEGWWTPRVHHRVTGDGQVFPGLLAP